MFHVKQRSEGNCAVFARNCHNRRESGGNVHGSAACIRAAPRWFMHETLRAWPWPPAALPSGLRLRGGLACAKRTEQAFSLPMPNRAPATLDNLLEADSVRSDSSSRYAGDGLGAKRCTGSGKRVQRVNQRMAPKRHRFLRARGGVLAGRGGAPERCEAPHISAHPRCATHFVKRSGAGNLWRGRGA